MLRNRRGTDAKPLGTVHEGFPLGTLSVSQFSCLILQVLKAQNRTCPSEARPAVSHARHCDSLFFRAFWLKTIEGRVGFQFFCTCRCAGFVDIVLHTLQVSNVCNRTHEGAADAVEMLRHVATQWPFCYVLLSLRWHFSDLHYGYRCSLSCIVAHCPSKFYIIRSAPPGFAIMSCLASGIFLGGPSECSWNCIW